MDRKLALFALIALAIGATGCGGDDEDGTPPEEDPGEHACEHVGEPGTAVTATADRATAPQIALSEEPYTVTLVPGQPSFVAIPGGEDALLFTKATGVVIGLYLEQETNNQLSAPEPNEFCPTEIPEHFDLELESAAGAWYVELAPSATSDVWMALLPAAGHGH